MNSKNNGQSGNNEKNAKRQHVKDMIDN